MEAKFVGETLQKCEDGVFMGTQKMYGLIASHFHIYACHLVFVFLSKHVNPY